jgi:PPP family 3-phenylpropionic acid transporter
MTISAQPRHPGGGATRLGAFYAASFLVVGIQLPFWPVWLTGRGLDAQEIAIVFAAAIWAKVIATPLLGALADRLGRRRAVMIALAASACVAYAGLWPVAGWWPLLALNLVAGMAQSALMPLGDSITLRAVREAGLDYGRIRVWGSVSFILASVGSGALLALNPGAGAGDNQILLLVLAASATLLFACIGIPRATRRTGVMRPRWAALGRLAADRRFWLFVASAAALQSSHQLYYGFGTLHWRVLGFSTRSSAPCGPRASSPRSCCSGTARHWSPALGRSG